MPDSSGVESSSADVGVPAASRTFGSLRESLSIAHIGAAFTAFLVVYFAFVVPENLAVLLVGSAAALVFAAYAPLVGVLAVGWLIE